MPDESQRYFGNTSLWPEVAGLAPELRISLGWTAALCNEEQQIHAVAARDVPFFRYAAVGFLDEAVDLDYKRGSFPPFGVILYAEQGKRREAEVEHLEPLKVAGVAFPVVVRRGAFLSNFGSPGSGVPAGQLACWATTRGGTLQGWLTARHIAGDLGTVIDAATDCTDAALVSTPIGRPIGVSRVSAYGALSGGVDAVLRFHQSKVPAKVLDVSTDFDLYRNPKFPVRFSLNRPGQPGNSGALITEAKTGRPLGIHLGSFVPATAGMGQAPSGCGLAIYQLEKMLEMEVFV